MILKRIYLIRHAQTTWNIHGRFQGKTDTPLSEAGLTQTRRLAERLKEAEIDLIYCSPLKRAFDTAEPIARARGLAPITREELREVDFGRWEGLTVKEIKERYPVEYEKCRNDPLKYGFRFGLPFEDVRLTVKRFADNYIHNNDMNVAIVSHSVAIKMLLLHLIGLPAEFIHSFRIDNCSVSVIGVGNEINDNKYTILKINDTGGFN